MPSDNELSAAARQHLRACNNLWKELTAHGSAGTYVLREMVRCTENCDQALIGCQLLYWFRQSAVGGEIRCGYWDAESKTWRYVRSFREWSEDMGISGNRVRGAIAYLTHKKTPYFGKDCKPLRNRDKEPNTNRKRLQLWPNFAFIFKQLGVPARAPKDKTRADWIVEHCTERRKHFKDSQGKKRFLRAGLFLPRLIRRIVTTGDDAWVLANILLDFTKGAKGRAGCNARHGRLLYSADTRKDLARRLGMTESRVRYSLQRLKARKLIEREQHKYQAVNRTFLRPMPDEIRRRVQKAIRASSTR